MNRRRIFASQPVEKDRVFQHRPRARVRIGCHRRETDRVVDAGGVGGNRAGVSPDPIEGVELVAARDEQIAVRRGGVEIVDGKGKNHLSGRQSLKCQRAVSNQLEVAKPPARNLVSACLEESWRVGDDIVPEIGDAEIEAAAAPANFAAWTRSLADRHVDEFFRVDRITVVHIG